MRELKDLSEEHLEEIKKHTAKLIELLIDVEIHILISSGLWTLKELTNNALLLLGIDRIAKESKKEKVKNE